MRFAATIDPRLGSYLERLARERELLPIAEINRRVGERAEALGLYRPSYAAVRLLVGDARIGMDEPSWGELALHVAFRAKPVSVLEDKWAKNLDKYKGEDWGLRKPRR